MEKLKIGVSACLLGQNVRYNGGHQLNHFIRDILGQYMEFVPVCPEVGMRPAHSPRDPAAGGQRGAPAGDQPQRGRPHRADAVLGRDQGQTARTGGVVRLHLQKGFAEQRPLPGQSLFGAGHAPQCGHRHVRPGLHRALPLLPVEEDGRLNDGRLRENYQRVRANTGFLGTFTDWRLPTIKELMSLVDYGQNSPALPVGHPFTNIPSTGGYWSSTTSNRDQEKAYVLRFQDGDVLLYGKPGDVAFTWCVRGGK